MGNGNIGGVALAIAVGGPGATFDDTLWLIRVCRLNLWNVHLVFAIEIWGGWNCLWWSNVLFEQRLEGGGLARLGKFLAVTFALLCIGASFGGGNAQSNQAAMQLVNSLECQEAVPELL